MGVITVAGGYLLGSILPAVWFVKRQTGKTPWEMGDNPGTMGVWRLAGPKRAVVTVVFDIAKGVIPLAVAQYLNLGGMWLAAAACAPVAGHNWSLFHGFRGGRGLATSAGTLLKLSWDEMCPAYVLGVIIAYWKKWAPMTGVVAFPIGLIIMIMQGVERYKIIIALCVMCVVLVRQIPWVVCQVKQWRSRCDSSPT